MCVCDAICTHVLTLFQYCLCIHVAVSTCAEIVDNNLIVAIDLDNYYGIKFVTY